MDPSIVGIFDGTAQGEDGPPGAVEIRRMIFFRDNIYLLANDKEKLEEELWTAIRNEIGHFLGLNEEELAERGLE
jgi:predicted Zn-dependent protease with MMP-like domain